MNYNVSFVKHGPWAAIISFSPSGHSYRTWDGFVYEFGPMFSPGLEEEERARARAEEAYSSQLREWQSDEEGDEVRTGWPDGRSHRPNRKLGRYFEPLGGKIC